VTSLHALLRLAHIVLGFAALVTGVIPILVAKGGPAHRFWGKVYVASLGLSSALALVLAVRRSDVFMASLSVLTLYFLVSGLRARAWGPGAAVGFDRGAALLLLALSLASLLWSLFGPGALPVVPLVFGVLGAVFATRDLLLLRSLENVGGIPYFQHFLRMLSSYIAATTAFSVTNLHALPFLVRWLWPTVLGTIAITLLARRSAREAREQEEQAALAAAALDHPEIGFGDR
jgi:hypothetical protein